MGAMWHLVYVFLADFFTWLVSVKLVENWFFGHYLELNEFDMDEQERFSKLMEWHEKCSTGQKFTAAIIVVFSTITLSLAAVFPQPRASLAVWLFILYLFWQNIVKPFIQAFFMVWLLRKSTKVDFFDGVLSYYPGFMDFLYTDVQTCEFLAWRLHRIVKEEVILKEVHESPFAAQQYRETLSRMLQQVPNKNTTSNTGEKNALSGFIGGAKTVRKRIDALDREKGQQKKDKKVKVKGNPGANSLGLDEDEF